jgi:hypothetical protein
VDHLTNPSQRQWKFGKPHTERGERILDCCDDRIMLRATEVIE